MQNAALQSALQDLRGLSRRCEAKSTELDEVMENTAALRHRMGFLKEEVASTKAEAAMAASVVGEAPLEILEALQRELGAEDDAALTMHNQQLLNMSDGRSTYH